jgi:hypothetical protein
MTIKFTTRAGQTFTIAILEDIGHAFIATVIKGGGKLFVGKAMAFAKNDMNGLEVLA